MYPSLFTTPGVAKFAAAVDVERAAQITKFGDQRHPDLSGDASLQCDQRDHFAQEAEYYRSLNSRGAEPDWSGILLEEAFEAVAEADPAKIRAELIQVAAVCAAWVSDIDRRPTP